MTELLRVSPSSLSAFDPETAFGCRRRWWFRYVMKLPDPAGPGAELGTKVHNLIENRVVTNYAVPETNAQVLAIANAAEPFTTEMRNEGGWSLEVKVEDKNLLPGVLFTGRIDALHPATKRIRDWKTMRTLQYAKPSQMLRQDFQMQLYAAALAEPGEEIVVEHINLTTLPPHQATRTHAVSTQAARDVVVDKALALVAGMREYMLISDVNDAEPDRSKCRFCSFKDRCPTGEKTVNLFDSILSASTPATTPAPLAPAAFAGERDSDRAATAALASIVPPEMNVVAGAPKHKLIIQTEAPAVPAPVQAPPPPPPTPVQAPTPVKPPAQAVEEPKRGRGRPKLPRDEAGNVVREQSGTQAALAGSSVVVQGADAAKPTVTAGLDVKTITVTRGATVQVIQFEPFNVSVSAVAEVRGMDLKSAVDLLDRQVMELVIERVTALQESKAKAGVIKKVSP